MWESVSQAAAADWWGAAASLSVRDLYILSCIAAYYRWGVVGDSLLGLAAQYRSVGQHCANSAGYNVLSLLLTGQGLV
jgi:hypothetical protein